MLSRFKLTIKEISLLLFLSPIFLKSFNTFIIALITKGMIMIMMTTTWLL